MEKELIDTFTNEQLLMCEKETLIKYINDLRDFWPMAPSAGSDKKNIIAVSPLERFLNEKCVIKQNVMNTEGLYPIAPTSFDDLFYDYRWFCKEVGESPVLYSHKKEIKHRMLEAQKQTEYGLSLGTRKKDGKKNGTHYKPCFNFVFIEDE